MAIADKYPSAAFHVPRQFLDHGPRPTSGECVEADDCSVEVLRSFEVEVYVPFHGYLAGLAGKRSDAREMTNEDIYRSQVPDLAKELRDDIGSHLKAEYFDAVIVPNNKAFPALMALLQKTPGNFVPAETAYGRARFGALDCIRSALSSRSDFSKHATRSGILTAPSATL